MFTKSNVEPSEKENCTHAQHFWNCKQIRSGPAMQTWKSLIIFPPRLQNAGNSLVFPDLTATLNQAPQNLIFSSHNIRPQLKPV